MKLRKKIFKKVGSIFVVGALLLTGNLPFGSCQVQAASSDIGSSSNSLVSNDDDLKLWYDTMAGTNFSGDAYDNNESFYKALPLGNGRIGAMVYGNYPDERIDLNEATFWSSGPSSNDKAGAASYLAQAQALMYNGQYKDGDTLIKNNMIGGGEAKYQAVGNLKLAFGHSSVTGYSRQLDMNNGVVSSDYTYEGKNYHRESFVSYPDQVLVTRVTCSQPGSVSFTASYESSLSGQYTVSTADLDTLVMNGHGDSDNGVNYAVSFSTRSKIINTNGSLTANDSSVTVSNADSVVILTSVRTNFVDYKTCNGDEKGKAIADITNALAKPYTTLFNNHVKDYQNLFKRVDVDLGGSGSENSKPMGQRISEFSSTNDPKLAKVLFQYGRYLMITASRDNQPMNLQGIWNKFRNPAWGCKMTTNINYEMNYWSAFTTNLEECFKPFVEKAKSLQAPGNATARAHYNISNGWVVHHNTDIWNRTAPIDGEWGLWPTGAGWISNMLYDAYNFNQDKAYLNEVYPVIKGSADFLQTLMQSYNINGQDYQVICPSTSPEVQTPSSSGGQGAYCSYGVTMDNGIARELFKDVINASSILNTDTSFRSTLQNKVSQIKPGTVGSWGQLQEWAYDWDSSSEKNRHISQVYELFPGNEINKRNNPALYNAAATSLNARGDDGTGWSESWKLNCWARLEDGAHAYNLVKLLITPVNSSGRLYDNLWDAHPPFQIDGNFGFTSGITEMLLQSHNNEIQLLPALPAQWSTGHANGLRARGNFTITQMNWTDGSLDSVYIKSNSGNICNVRYGSTTVSFPTKAGETYKLNSSLQLIDSSIPALSNVALNKNATASGNNSGEDASKVIDGSTSTKWCHDQGMTGEWVQIDLGTEYNISRYIVKHAGTSENAKFNTRDFTLQKSQDAKTWTDVDSVYGNVQTITDRNVPSFNARYVRLYVNTATQDNTGGARIYELELWGNNEAENGILGGNAAIIDDNQASGGKAVSLSSVGDSISFNNLAQASQITFRYSTDSNPGKLSLYVNEAHIKDIGFTNNGSVGYANQTVSVSIPLGSNIKLQFDNGDSATKIDAITFTLFDLSSVAFDLTSGQITGTSTNMEYSVDSTDGINGTWTTAKGGNTPITAKFGSVYIREASNHSNYRLLGTLPYPSEITIDGKPFTDFSTSETIYSIPVAESSVNAPVVAAVAGNGCNVTVTQAQAIPGNAKITSTSDLGTFTYTLCFDYPPKSTSFMEGQIDSHWTILNPDTANYSVVTGMGLRLPTQANDIYSTARNWTNVFLRSAAGNWDVVSKVYFPASPSANYQQQALLVWQDDDNYIKLDCENNNSTSVKIQLAVEKSSSFSSAGSQVYSTTPGTPLTLYFRIKKTNHTYTGYYSTDGINYITLGTTTFPLINQKIGVFATRNSSNAEIDTYCQSIDVMAAPDADATLKNLQINGIEVSDFKPSILDYNINLPAGTQIIPTVTATANSGNATMSITPATSLPGTTTVVVSAQDGTTKKTYKINFLVQDQLKPFKITALGDLDRSSGIIANVQIDPLLDTASHDGTEVIVFQLMHGITPVSIAAIEKNITSAEKLTAYFNVESSDKSYEVRVYVLDKFSNDISAPISLAESVTLH